MKLWSGLILFHSCSVLNTIHIYFPIETSCWSFPNGLRFDANNSARGANALCMYLNIYNQTDDDDFIQRKSLSPSMLRLRQEHQWLRTPSMASWSSWERARSLLIRWRQGITTSSMMATPSSTLASVPLQNSCVALSFNAFVTDNREGFFLMICCHGFALVLKAGL